MKYLIAAAALTVCSAGAPAFAQVEQKTLPKDEVAKIKADVIKAATEYLVYFSNSDGKSVAEKSYAPVAVAVGPNGIEAQDRAKTEAGFNNSFVNLKKSGWVKSAWVKPVVCVLNPNVAFLSSTYRRYDKNNKVIADLNETLVYLRDKDGWKIVGNYPQPMEKTVTCND
jgi:hypothetical protein